MEPTQDELTLTEDQQAKPQEMPLNPQQEQLREMLREIQEEQEKSQKSGGILLPFLIVLLVIVGMVDLALASYIGFYYMNVGQYSYVESVPQNPETGTVN